MVFVKTVHLWMIEGWNHAISWITNWFKDFFMLNYALHRNIDGNNPRNFANPTLAIRNFVVDVWKGKPSCGWKSSETSRVQQESHFLTSKSGGGAHDTTAWLPLLNDTNTVCLWHLCDNNSIFNLEDFDIFPLWMTKSCLISHIAFPLR